MKIVKVEKNTLNKFLDFPDRLYAGDPNYVPYMRSDLKKTLSKLIIERQKYTALIALDDNDQVVGRVIFTIGKDKQLKTNKCGFFSLYECINDKKVSSMMLGEMFTTLKNQGAEYVSGSFFPHDPENRRGIMVEGFDRAPLIFTSYNPRYYPEQMEAAGLVKHTDTLEYVSEISEDLLSAIQTIAEQSMKEHNYRVDRVNLKHPDRDIDDVYRIMTTADHGIIYQDAPSKELLSKTFYSMKNFLDADLIYIARSNEDNQPMGFTMSIPDFNQVIKKMRGRMDLKGLFYFLTESRKITSFRGMLQYVAPPFQRRGINKSLYAATLSAAIRKNYNYCELGTIVEDNIASCKSLEKAGATICRRYRIYYKKLNGGKNAE